ncbi:YdcF family protein [Flavitalea sp.]|nr:YdcF family protein [Flavitalea sp.]
MRTNFVLQQYLLLSVLLFNNSFVKSQSTPVAGEHLVAETGSLSKGSLSTGLDNAGNLHPNKTLAIGPDLPVRPVKEYKLHTYGGFVQSKNYYLLTLFSERADLISILSTDTELKQITKNKKESLFAAIKTCGRNKACLVSTLQFSNAEIEQVSKRLSLLCSPGSPLASLVKTDLIPSGTYILYQQLKPEEMLVKAWEQDARGINFAIGVYAGGLKPNYPNIDSISLHVADQKDTSMVTAGHAGLIYNTAWMSNEKHSDRTLFYTLPLEFALRFIEMNERALAADFEPMQVGENRAAFETIAKTNWQKFPYSVILVPGAGPGDPGVALSAEAIVRCQLAAIEYKKGLAPYIIPSGGKVHPYKTKFNEAIEMKQYLIHELGIPESAIIIDPHARHTTTNMRNAARLMFRYGIPFEKVALTCTTRGQSFSIGTTLAARCQKELDHVPFKVGKRLNETLLEFYPLIEALHIDPNEPMDP